MSRRVFRRARSNRSFTLATVVAVIVGLCVSMPSSAVAQDLSSGSPGSSPLPATTAGTPAALLKAYQSRPADAAGQLASTRVTPSQLTDTATKNGVAEIASMRQQSSRTFATPTGDLETVFGQQPINYKDGNGNWQPINDDLVADTASGFAWQNSADSYRVEFPQSLADGPIKVSVGSKWTGVKLTGASSVAATVSGNTITYPNALPGVTITYHVSPVGVKETMQLASASAASTFAYSLTTSSTLGAVLNAGGVAIGASQDPLFTISNAWASDAGSVLVPVTNVVDTTLSALTGSNALTVTVDKNWLTDPARTFPVTVDPTIVINSTTEGSACTMQSGEPTVSNCDVGYGTIGNNGDAYGTRRSLAQFNFNGTIAHSGIVHSAKYSFYFKWMTGTSPISMQFWRNDQSWNSSYASWSKADSSNQWKDPVTGSTTTGGAAVNNTNPANPPSETSYFTKTINSTDSGYEHVYLTALVQKWVEGSVDNHGMLIRSKSETTSTGLFAFNDIYSGTNLPTLDVDWSARTGDNKIHTLLNRNLTDKTTLGVDPATGNVLMSTTDMSIVGTGPDSTLSFKHYYNSYEAYIEYAAPNTMTTAQMGTGWIADNSLDSTVTLWDASAGGAASVVMPGGVQDVFTRTNATSAWNSPDGVNAEFHHDDPNHHSWLIDHKSGLRYDWTDTGSVGGGPEVGHLTTITTPTNRTITFDNNTPGHLIITDTKGRTYDEVLAPAYSGGPNLIQSITDTNSGRSVSFGYNTSGQMTSYTDATGAVTNYSYDPTSGQLTEISDPSTGHDTTLQYNTSAQSWQGEVNTITQTTTDCAGGSTTQHYATTYSYSSPASGGPSSAVGSTDVTDPKSDVTHYYWDAKRRVINTVDPAGNSHSNDYDPVSGQVNTFTDDLTHGVTTLKYDGSDMLSKVTEPTDSGSTAGATNVQNSDTNSSDPGYQGPASVPTSVTDPQGNVTTYHVPATGDQYGGESLVTKVSQLQSTGNTSQQLIDYNTDGTLSAITNSNNNQTTYGYDGNGNLSTITPPSPQSASNYTEDSDNRLHTKTDGNNNTTTYLYDNNDRPTKVTYNDGSYVQYWYDTDGNLIQRRDRDGTVDTLTYDGLNRPTSQTFEGETQTFCYDRQSRLTSLTNGGGTVTYNYTPNGVLNWVGEPGSSGCSNYNTSTTLPPANSRCIEVKMDQNNRPAVIAFPGGVTSTTTYLNSGKISAIKVTNGTTTDENLSLSYVKAGAETDLLQTRTDSLATGTTGQTSYIYNGMNQLKQATGVITNTGGSGYTATNRTDTWTYDTEGNITIAALGSNTTYYTYDNADELCHADNTAQACGTLTSGTEYHSDANGNLNSASNGFSATHDVANTTTQMANIDDGTGNYTAGYLDYGQNDRVSFDDTGNYDNYTFTDSILGLASATETSPSSNQRIDYTRLPSGQLLSMRIGSTTNYNPNTTSNSYYSMVDGQNSVLGMTDSSGNVAARYAYDPYGTELANSNTTTANTNRNRWLGAYFDPQTDLYHFGARYYSPQLSRFLQTDPKTHPLDLTQQDEYSYAGGDPVNATDLSGLDCGDTSSPGACEGFGAIGVSSGLIGGSEIASAGIDATEAGALVAGASLTVLGAGVIVGAVALGAALFNWF